MRRSGPLSSALRGAAWCAVAAGVATPLVRRHLGLPRPAVSALVWQAPVALSIARPRSPGRDVGIYALQMWAYFAHYQMPNDDPEALAARVRVRYAVRADTRLALGEAPTLRLQRRLGRPGRVCGHDLALAWVHWVWFFVPHSSLVYVLVRRPDQFPRAACLTAAVFDLGLVGYWAVPTAPPWWAGQNGDLPAVRRIMVEAGRGFWKRLWLPLYDLLGGNPFAAMPSLHFATSVMAAHVLSDVDRVAGAVGWSYAVVLGFALVYLGEHYVIDLAAGLALAEGVRRLAPRAGPLLRTVEDALRRLEPRPA